MRWFDRLSLIFYADLGLFIFSILRLTPLIGRRKDFLTNMLKQALLLSSDWFENLIRPMGPWQNLSYWFLLLGVCIFFLKFWRVGFVILEIIALFYVLIFGYQLVQGGQSWNQAFYLGTLVLSLVNAWALSRQMGWLKN